MALKGLLAAILILATSFVCAGSSPANMDAVVHWRLSLDAEGNVTQLSPTLIKANDTIREALEPAIRKWKFIPGSTNGVPATTETTLVVDLSLVPTDDDQSYSIRFNKVSTGGSVGEHNRAPSLSMSQAQLLRTRGHGAELVVLVATYDADGNVTEIVAADGSPVIQGTFYNSALSVLRTWKFIPERVAGIGISGRAIVPFCFTSATEETEVGCEWAGTGSGADTGQDQGLALDSKVQLLTDLNPKSP